MIYIVTQHEADDYSIAGVFDKKEIAEMFISSFKKDAYLVLKIEEWDLNPHKNDMGEGMSAFMVMIDRDGNVIRSERKGSSYGFRKTVNGCAKDVFTTDGEHMICFCFAKDKEHSIEIANERRNLSLENDMWGKEFTN